jgi:hypothetical protein
MSGPLTSPSRAANDTAMRILTPPAHGPIPIPGAFGPRNRPALPADPAPARTPAPNELHDRAQNEHEIEGGGDRRYRQAGVSRGFIGRLFDLVFRTKS